MGLQTTGRNRAPEASAGRQGMIARKHINECTVPHFKSFGDISAHSSLVLKKLKIFELPEDVMDTRSIGPCTLSVVWK